VTDLRPRLLRTWRRTSSASHTCEVYGSVGGGVGQLLGKSHGLACLSFVYVRSGWSSVIQDSLIYCMQQSLS